MANRVQGTRSIGIETDLGDDALILIHFTGTESMSDLFQFSLTLISERIDLTPADIVGKQVNLWVKKDEEQKRYFNGYIKSFSAKAAVIQGFRTFTATLVPWLWFLAKRSDCRIYQNKTVLEVVEQVLSSNELANFEISCTKTYPTKDFCVQYRETDLDFVSRLLNHNGILYYFTHDQNRHTLKIIDDATAYDICIDSNIIHTEGELLEPHIASWEHNFEFFTGKWAQTDFNYQTPAADISTASSSVVTLPNTDKYEHFDYPGNYPDRSAGSTLTDSRMAKEEQGYEIVQAASNYHGLMAGAKFTVDVHDLPEEVGKEFAIIQISHEAGDDTYFTEGEGRTPYTNEFSAVPANFAYLARNEISKPVVFGPQTAIIVGPEGEEIHTDQLGRVKVSFHWDRYCSANETDSCWVRVSQAWAGNKWGGISIPRIGQEVIVSFINGDPDFPIITGRVYNAACPPPYDLPANATMTTFKTNTSKEGRGFNEIRMEDKKDEEQIFMHAQKNMDVRVKNDRFENVDHDAHLVVGNIKKEHVKNERHETVDSHHVEKITGDRNLKVAGKEAKEVAGSLSLKVSSDVIEVFEQNHSEQVTSDYYLKASNVVIEATTNITLKVGQSFIAIESGGITIGSTGDVELDSSANVSIVGAAGVAIESSAAVEATSANTTIKGDAMLTLEGGFVKIN